MKWLITLILMCSVATAQVVVERAGLFPYAHEGYVGLDGFGYFYFVTPNQVLIKEGGASPIEYKNLNFGRIARADIMNPLMIVLFYENFNAVVLLDNQLNEIRTIQFNERNDQFIIRAAGLASQNRLWVYDSVLQQVMLYDFQQDEFQKVGTPLREGISYYETTYNEFRWIDLHGNSFTMDLFGRVVSLGKTGPAEVIRFLPDGRRILLRQDKFYLTEAGKDIEITVPDVGKSVKNFYLKEQILSIFTSHGITNFKIKFP